MKIRAHPFTLGILAILSWSTIASAFKVSLEYADLTALLLIATITSIVFLFLVLVLSGKMDSLLRLKAKDLFLPALTGLLNPFVYYLVLLNAYTMLKAQEAGTLNYIWPVTLTLLSVPLLGKKLPTLSFIAIMISFAGIVVVATEGNPASLEFKEPLGVLLATGCSIFWSLFWIINLRNRQEETLKLLLSFCFGAIYLLIYMAFTGFDMPGIKGIAGGVYIGIFEMGLPFLLWLTAMKRTNNTALLANLVYLSPFISLFVIRIIVGEHILPSTIGGLSLIVGGILLQGRTSRYSKGKTIQNTLPPEGLGS